MGKYSSHAEYRNGLDIEVPSATTVLKILMLGDGLMNWSNFIGFKRIKYKDFMEEASSFGTLVHDAIEHYFKDGEYYPEVNPKYPEELPKLEFAVKNFLAEFIGAYDVEHIWSEKKFAIERYGGTVDMYCKIDGTPTIIDFKTSSDFKLQQFLQLGAYTQMLEHDGYEVQQVGIVIVNAKRCAIRLVSRQEIEAYIIAFNSLVETFHALYDIIDRDKWKGVK